MSQIYAFLPSIRVFQFFGLNPFSIDKNFCAEGSRGLKFYSLFQIFLSLFVMAGSIYESNFYLNMESSGISDIVDYLQLIGFRLAHLTTIIEAVYHQKSLIKFFTSLNEVDDMIGKLKSRESFDHRMSNYYAINSAVVFYIGVQLIALVTIILQRDVQAISYSYWSSSLLPYFVCCLRSYQVINCVWFIKKRFDILNIALAKVDLQSNPIKHPVVRSKFRFYKTDGNHLVRSKPMASFEMMIMFRQMYDKLYVLSTIINYSFGLSNLINTAVSFVSITSNIYFTFLSLQNFSLENDDELKILAHIFWSLPHIMNIIAISAACYFTNLTVSRKLSSLNFSYENLLISVRQNWFNRSWNRLRLSQ